MDETTKRGGPSHGGLSPVRGGERVVALDVLRGMGIVGILFVNIGLFSGAWQLFPTVPEEALPARDRVVEFLISVFAEGKFISTLAFLFGLGFAWQAMRAEERGRSSGRLLVRRMLALGLFGLVHAIFIWSGDILLTYALVGLALILFRRCRPKTLLVWAGALVGVPLLLLLLAIVVFALFMSFGDPEQVARSQAGGVPFLENLAESAREAYNSGSYPEMVVQRLKETILLTLSLVFLGPFILAMMLVGAAVARAGWLRNLDAHRLGVKWAAVFGLSIGLPLNVAYGVSLVLDPESSGVVGLAGFLCWFAGAPILAVGYMAAMTLFVFRRPGGEVFRRLSAVGRLALSNYLIQSIVMTAIFYGLAIYGEVGITSALVLALALVFVQLLVSPLYLKRFSSGPAEWLWRRITYGRAEKGSA